MVLGELSEETGTLGIASVGAGGGPVGSGCEDCTVGVLGAALVAGGAVDATVGVGVCGTGGIAALSSATLSATGADSAASSFTVSSLFGFSSAASSLASVAPPQLLLSLSTGIPSELLSGLLLSAPAG
jgi:hypothetical protein